ncbi:MAG: response regulator transcription factor [Flavobacteriaceae bacterium]
MGRQDLSIRVAIVDDDNMVANLLREFFDRSDIIDTIYVANSGNQFFEKLEEEDILPDVVLLDLRMKDGDGFEVLERLSEREKLFKVIVMSNYYNLALTEPMLKLGCDAFLPKQIEIKELLEVIEKVHLCGHYFPEELIVNLGKQVARKNSEVCAESKDTLSPREIEVLELLSQQLSIEEISKRMFLTIKEVQAHKSNLLLKTGVKNTAGLVIYAIQNKLIDVKIPV